MYFTPIFGTNMLDLKLFAAMITLKSYKLLLEAKPLWTKPTRLKRSS